MINKKSNIRILAITVILVLGSEFQELKADDAQIAKPQAVNNGTGSNAGNVKSGGALIPSLKHNGEMAQKTASDKLGSNIAASGGDADVKKQPQTVDTAENSNKKNSELDSLPVVNTNYGKLHNDMNINVDESIKGGFYILFALSASGVLFVLFKLYKMRLTRAERKYGVQGDHTTQELTPLPMAIEDINSDDEDDHTLFELNRHQIRIL